jgi:hypothetical protein
MSTTVQTHSEPVTVYQFHIFGMYFRNIQFKIALSLLEYFLPLKQLLFYFEANTPNGRCHPEARYYKTNFKKKKEELCKKLFSLYNDKVFDNKVRNINCKRLCAWNTVCPCIVVRLM